MSARPEDLARLIAGIGGASTVLLTGTVTAWDSDNGFTVQAGGSTFAATVILTLIAAPDVGDTVALLVYKGTVLILGPCRAPAFATGDGQG
jgi:hypothetical protein